MIQILENKQIDFNLDIEGHYYNHTKKYQIMKFVFCLTLVQQDDLYLPTFDNLLGGLGSPFYPQLEVAHHLVLLSRSKSSLVSCVMICLAMAADKLLRQSWVFLDQHSQLSPPF